MRLARLAAAALVLAAASPAVASEPGTRAAEAAEALTSAADAVVRDDRSDVEESLDAALSAARAARDAMDDSEVAPTLGGGLRRTRRRADRLVARTAALAEEVAIAETPRRRLVRSAERAAREANRLQRRLARRTSECPVILARGRRGETIRSSGGRVRLRALPWDAGFGIEATLRIAEGDGTLTFGRKGRWRLRTEDAPGAVRLEAEACGRATSLWVVVTGPRRDLDDPLDEIAVPGPPLYSDTTPSFRVGEPATLAAPQVGGAPPDTFAVAPALPAGLALDPATGAISGTPSAPALPADHVVTASNAEGSAEATLRIEVTPALPEGVAELEPGFAAEPLLTGLDVPVKLAFTPDGRLLFTELMTGNVRVVGADGTLREDPFHTLSILTGGERGLLGIAVAPDFDVTGHVFLYASVPAGNGHPDRNQVLRLTAVGDSGTDPTEIIDDLPVGSLHNAGDLEFGADGMLYVSIGDVGDPANAQTDGVRAGRILRFAPDGGIPGDNPIEGDPEWCRGLRNPFGLAAHPVTGGLYITENGPTSNDELLFAQPEKNFEWGPVPPDLPEFLKGFTLTSWTPVIVPTGITFVSAAGFGDAFANDLFLCGYDLAEVRRIRLSGELLTDIDEEETFLLFEDGEEIANKPLDATEGPDGALYVSTFSGIWRIHRWGR